MLKADNALSAFMDDAEFMENSADMHKSIIKYFVKVIENGRPLYPSLLADVKHL